MVRLADARPGFENGIIDLLDQGCIIVHARNANSVHEVSFKSKSYDRQQDSYVKQLEIYFGSQWRGIQKPCDSINYQFKNL